MKTADLGKIVREQRKLQRMNQTELALVSGTGIRFIGELERGKERCELGKTLKVLANLGIEIVVKGSKGGGNA